MTLSVLILFIDKLNSHVIMQKGAIMPNYIINKNSDEKGFNEVHNTAICSHLPEIYNQVDLGQHTDENAAVDYAKRIGWRNADGCKYCCPNAHRG